jgi:hypothetical protein
MLLEVLFELIAGLIEFGLEFFIEVLMGGADLPVPDLPDRWSPLLATLGHFVTGGSAGGLSVWLLPDRIFQAGPIPGLSCVLAPLATGLALAAWGHYQRAQGQETTSLATWWGGGSLALGVALVRFMVLA